MKSSLSAALVGLTLVVAGVREVGGVRAVRKTSFGRTSGGSDRTITKVVKLLQQLLEDSKAEGEQERELYAKHKCYCDDNTADKTESVAELTKQIGLLENNIQELQGSNALLSSESAQLSKDMEANVQARADAEALRTKENQAFLAEEADLTAAIGQLAQAIEVLAAIGSDQTLQAAADHNAFMAGYNGSSLLKLRATVKQALLAANTFLSPTLRSKAEAFLQAPFTGTYSSQSGAIFGILKQMQETFESNLASAKATEEAAVKAHTALMATKLEEHTTMKTAYDEKQSTLGSNDASLSEKKTSLDLAVQQKADDEAFLEKLGKMCGDKAAEYEQRKMLRANEQAAISQAIAILDSDHAFNTFGKVKATSTGATELMALRQRSPPGHAGSTKEARRVAVRLLQDLARSHPSSSLARVVSLVKAGNPFTKVLEAIEKMKERIVEEGKVDSEQLAWCEKERQVNGDSLTAKNTQIGELEGAILGLDDTINNEATGLKVVIQQTEESLVQNRKSQTDETEIRRQENVVYQQSVDDTVEAQALLKKAIAALEKYYNALAEAKQKELESLLQEDPAPPATWEGSYTGQSEQGANVITMLKFVLTETEKEEALLHDGEHNAQLSYEDSMGTLKTEEGDLQTSLAESQKALADAEQELATKRDELDVTEREKRAIERYLEEIKPGCDFITDNFATREAHRSSETSALDSAVTKLKGTPAFAAAAQAEKEKAQGSCAPICAENEALVDCKACLAGVSIPGYCAGHPGTAGC